MTTNLSMRGQMEDNGKQTTSMHHHGVWTLPNLALQEGHLRRCLKSYRCASLSMHTRAQMNIYNFTGINILVVSVKSTSVSKWEKVGVTWQKARSGSGLTSPPLGWRELSSTQLWGWQVDPGTKRWNG